ncbi:damage-inducible protein CinA [Bartonella henselae]|uniref:Competence/damage-inducible protein CinA n=1 Tax=Bartonella henselae TaxID=38323 RepID=X5LZ31_BARHN|nr:CinA family protein [Bartonella henselae]MDM9996284.1 CinA family protein [Bartonella henselae]OLL48368.1 damage-inducible protein CinA [Bartonella henselae]OLL48696.1 damage-inducible protein CinA [Bartonella henselae]OLL49791.1 damage-inducible protein CinA [Bartonella henselae]OLL57343.1 damage-inducible protein CinA [Bartonella henselae]
MTCFCEKQAREVLTVCRQKSLRLTTVESCTGGLIAANLTNIAGSSDVLDCGFVVYSNEAKTRLVGVRAELIKTYGAVSKEVVLAMAEGGLKYSRAEIAVSVTGIAGPGGACFDKPVGLVHFAVAYKNHKTLHTEMRFGNLDRKAIRHATVKNALKLILESLQ